MYIYISPCHRCGKACGFSVRKIINIHGFCVQIFVYVETGGFWRDVPHILVSLWQDMGPNDITWQWNIIFLNMFFQVEDSVFMGYFPEYRRV